MRPHVPAFRAEERKYIWWLSIVTFLSRLALSLRGEANQASRLLIDDGYYLFRCARHLALGQGLTSDGIHPTNGIQPLIVFLEVPFFWVSKPDRWLGVRLCYVLFALFSAVSVALAARIMGRLRKSDRGLTYTLPDAGSVLANPVILCAGLWAFTYTLFTQLMNGLETGLYTMLILFLIDRYISIEDSGRRSLSQFARYGVLMGITILARIDALFILLALGVVELVRFRQHALGRIAALGSVSLLVSSPWWIFNYVRFGNIIPVSGLSESLGTIPLGTNIVVAITRLANISVAPFALRYNELAVVIQVLLAIGILSALAALLLRFRLHKAFHRLRNGILVPFGAAAIVLAVIYVVRFHVPYFIDRYFQPIRIVWLFYASALFSHFFLQ